MLAWLPTANNTPIPSSSLIADPPESDGKISFSPWAIPGFPLSSEPALEFLCACLGKQTLAPGIIVGKDLEFWSLAARLAGSLVAKQQFLPRLAKNLFGGKDQIFWQGNIILCNHRFPSEGFSPVLSKKTAAIFYPK